MYANGSSLIHIDPQGSIDTPPPNSKSWKMHCKQPLSTFVSGHTAAEMTLHYVQWCTGNSGHYVVGKMLPPVYV